MVRVPALLPICVHTLYDLRVEIAVSAAQVNVWHLQFYLEWLK